MESCSEYPSLADIQEHELVKQLMDDLLHRDNMVNFHGIPPDVAVYFRVDLQNFSKNCQGDIDILLVPPKCPENAIAIEVKRIKVGKTAFEKDSPNRLKELRDGTRQANLLANIGFSQVYYFVLVAVDSRYHNNQKRITFDGLTGPLNTSIDQALSSGTERLCSRIGLRRFDLIQSMDYAPLSTGAYHSDLKRLASPIPQPLKVTEWVQRVAATSQGNAR